MSKQICLMIPKIMLIKSRGQARDAQTAIERSKPLKKTRDLGGLVLNSVPVYWKPVEKVRNTENLHFSLSPLVSSIVDYPG